MADYIVHSRRLNVCECPPLILVVFCVSPNLLVQLFYLLIFYLGLVDFIKFGTMANPFAIVVARRAEMDARNMPQWVMPQYNNINNSIRMLLFRCQIPPIKKKDPFAICWPNQVVDVRVAFPGESLGPVTQEDPTGKS